MSVKKIYFVVSTMVLALFLSAQATAVEGNLPGGTAVSLTIDAPHISQDNTTLTGSAALGIGQTQADTTLIFVLDASGSTEQSSGLTLSCPDQNPIDQDPGDPVPDENEIIDCEIGAAIALNEQAMTLGTIDEVAMVMFAGDAVAADATPDSQYTPLVAPDADNDQNGQYDVHEILQSIQVAFLFGQESGFAEFNKLDTPDIVKTDYADALNTAAEVAGQSENSNIIIVMVSDGVNNAGVHVESALPILLPEKHVVIHTIAIPDASGFGGTCESDEEKRGSLQDIVSIQNGANGDSDGTCTLVSDPSTLPELLPSLIIPTITHLSVQLNDSPERPLTNAELSTPLPADGPIDIQFETAVGALQPGSHDVCFRLYAEDAGGQGDITECTTVVIESAHADLAIEMPLEPQLSESGTSGVQYIFEVTNHGPSAASDVMTAYTVPASVQILDATTSQGGCAIEDEQVVCHNSTLQNNQTVAIFITLEGACAPSADLLAAVSANEEDPTMENNTAVLRTTPSQLEYGDAPEYDHATHCDFSMEWLGLAVDGETAVSPNEPTDDGFMPITSGYPNQRLRATITTSGLGAARYGTAPDERLYLSIWVDYNQDGDWDDEGEHAVACDVAPGTRGQCNDQPVNWRSGDSLNFQIRFRLRHEIPDETWVRARLSYGEPVGPTGHTQFGETEDFTAVLFKR